METHKRICIKDETFIYGKRVQEIKRGTEYITSKEKDDGTCTVFASPHWIYDAPVSLFAGAMKFT